MGGGWDGRMKRGRAVMWCRHRVMHLCTSVPYLMCERRAAVTWMLLCKSLASYTNCAGVSPPGDPSRVLHQSEGSSSQRA